MQHFTKNTVSAAKWCNKCSQSTQHRVDGGRIGPCLACLAKLGVKHENALAKLSAPEQTKLF